MNHIFSISKFLPSGYLLTIVIIYQHASIYALFGVASIGTLIGYALVHYGMKTLPVPVRFRLRFDVSYMWIIIKKTWPIAVTIALNLIYLRADTIILSFYKSQESVGLYGAAYRVIDILAAFPHMFMGLLLPLLTVAWIAHNTDQIRAIWERAVTFFAILALPMVGGTLVVGRALMKLIAGSSFELSGDILKILIIATAMIFFGTLYTYMVFVIEKQRAMIKYFAFTAIVALIGYFIFIPLYSFWGAAWITVLSEIMIAVSAWFLVSQHISLPLPWAKITKCVLCTIVMMVVASVLLPHVPLLLVLVISALVYGGLCIMTNVVTIRDLKHLIRPA